MSQNALSRQLLQLMLKKKSNLAVAADVATAKEMLQIAEQAREHLVLLCWVLPYLACPLRCIQFAFSALLKLPVHAAVCVSSFWTLEMQLSLQSV